MNLFFKGFIIGIAKVIPGVSGAMLAVSFSLYDRLIEAVTHFFDNKRENIRFLFLVGSGIFLAIVCFSNVIKYFINNYYFVTLMSFIGLIIGGTYNYSKKVDYNIRNIMIILVVVILIVGISLFNIDNTYQIQGNYLDYMMFFLGGVIEIFSSIVPGISGTALLMMIGIYDNILMLFGNMLNINFILENIMIYISYGLGLGISFICFSLLISYLLKKYRMLFDTIIMGLSLSSLLLLIIMAFSNTFDLFSLIIGITLFCLGVIISYLFS